MKGLANMSCEEQLRKLGLFTLETAQEGPPCPLQLPGRRLHWGGVWSLLQWEDKSRWPKALTGEIQIRYQNLFFTVSAVRRWNSLLRVVELPSLEVSKGVWTWYWGIRFSGYSDSAGWLILRVSSNLDDSMILYCCFGSTDFEVKILGIGDLF